MHKIETNIVKDILKSNMALHDFGKPVKAFLDSELAKITDSTLFVINLLDANPIDYEFINVAFSSLVEQMGSNMQLFVVFKIGKWEREELVTGVIDALGLKKGEDDDEEEILKRNNFHLITIDEANSIQYLADMSKEHYNVLLEIDKLAKTNAENIKQTFNLSLESTAQILKDLISYKFIYSDKDIYHSIRSLI